MKPKITVLTPTIRPKGLALVEKALNRQTFTEFEWLVGTRRDLWENTTRGRLVVDDFKGGYWSLNRIYNKMVRYSRGELLVSWQDYTFSDPTTLEKFWLHYKTNPNALVTAVGNKYETEKFMVQTWQDPRERDDQGSFYDCYPWDIEANLCSIPKNSIMTVGGFDEQMDFEGFGFDARGVFERIDMMGGEFKIDQSIKSYSLNHDRPEGWDENNMIGKWTEYKRDQIDSGRYPVLRYLKRNTSEKE